MRWRDRRIHPDVSYWPKAAELSDATGRQQSGVHGTCGPDARHSRFRSKAADAAIHRTDAIELSGM
jgi:hypothetical protein